MAIRSPRLAKYCYERLNLKYLSPRLMFSRGLFLRAERLSARWHTLVRSSLTCRYCLRDPKRCRPTTAVDDTTGMSKRATSLQAAEPRGLSAGGKAIISVLLILHLAAVFAAPLAFASNLGGRARSPVADAVATALKPYIVAMYLDHGYFFFAPNPGPTHLVDYRVEFADGRPAKTGRFPDLATERPRLLYHRHFMLAEALNNAYAPPEPPNEPSPPPLTATAEERAQYELDRTAFREMQASWKRARGTYEAMRTSIEQHLLAKYGGDRVTLTRIEHRPPMPDEFAALHRPLNFPESYRELPESTARGGGR